MLQGTELVELDAKDGIGVYDVESGNLRINTSHPFVAAFYELFTKSASSLPLEMYAVAEILMEAYLYSVGMDDKEIIDILAYRDELLRNFVKSSARRTAGMIALALLDAKDDQNKLEEEMRAAFEAMGFAHVISLGGSGKPDGTADAYLPASENGVPQRYRVGLEAKSGGTVSAKRLGVSGIARHMREFGCDHHIVIGNGFNTSSEEESATVKEIDDHKAKTGKTITLMHIDDMARLVRLVPAKRIGLKRLRELFSKVTPTDSKAWVDIIAKEKPKNWPYREILETIWERAEGRPSEPVEYGMVMTALEFRKPPIIITKQELIECCRSMQVMATNVLYARENTVELQCRPDLVLQNIHAALDSYPEEERKTIVV
jgi:hypothetical protein